MSKKIIACDLGTGGNKASLYDEDGSCLESVFIPYNTHYPRIGWHEQRPEDWWDAVVKSIRGLMQKRPDEIGNVEAISFSGHSLGVVPVGKNGELLRSYTPIWSDTRAEKQVEEFFRRVDERTWYLTTGNGFPPPCYAIFKIMWYRDNESDMFRKVKKILGTKDYINFRLTGSLFTDYSYASGSGVYDLKASRYSPSLLEASGIEEDVLPEIVPSTQVVGEITRGVAEILGLRKGVKVVCGGVDNSCMALGARNISEGRVYTSLGSSSWIAVSSAKPIVEYEHRPFVFTHVIPAMFTSAVSIFSAGSALEWVKDNLCRNLILEARNQNRDVYELMDEYAERSPIGANKLLFNPSLAGGSSQEPTPHIRGAFAGIDLGHTQSDILRSCMEGIAMNLGIVLDLLRGLCSLSDEMLMVGGGSRSPLWRRIFADVYNMKILKTNIDRDAGSLGAAALAAVGTELWRDFGRIDEIHRVEDTTYPIEENVEKYRKLLPAFHKVRASQASLGEILHRLVL